MAKGQASAIGAVFLVIIIALSLSYVVWAIAQIRELNEGVVKALSLREERRREKVSLSNYQYVEYANYTYSSIEGNLTSTCITIGQETSTELKSVLRDNFDNDPSSNGWTGSDPDTRPPLIFSRYWGPGINNYSIGFTANASWWFRIVDSSEGYWSRSFAFSPKGNITSAWLSIDYRVETSDWLAFSGYASWTLSVELTLPNGSTYTIAKTSPPIRHTGEETTDGRFYVSITEYMTEQGTYTITLRGSIRLNIRAFLAGHYSGVALFDNLVISVATTTTMGGISVCKATAITRFDLPSEPLSTHVVVTGELNDTATLYILYYDMAASTWRLADYLIPEGGEPFTVTLNIDPERFYNEGEASLMFVMEGSRPFELTLNTLLVECGFISDQVNITVMNTYSLPVKIVSIWVMNSTHVWRFEESAVLLPGEAETFELPIKLTPNSVYTVRVVTERGNLFDTVIET